MPDSKIPVLKPLVRSIKLTNFLSFGSDSEDIPLEPLNILIGANGSGKSNFIDAFELLRGAPRDIQEPIRAGGGISEWIWKGKNSAGTASLEAVFGNVGGRPLHYRLDFCEAAQRFEVVDEILFGAPEDIYYHFNGGNISLPFVGGYGAPPLPSTTGYGNGYVVKRDSSIFAQLKDSVNYPEITSLGERLSEFAIFRDWSFGRTTTLRSPQKADLPNQFLSEDCTNLGLIMNKLGQSPDSKAMFITALKDLYEGIEDYNINIEGGTVQVFLQEGKNMIPATRLSDGTLRYLCLLAILCHPTPPPLICIEEPELGLHPDILPTIARLLKKASERTQLIVTTHSDVLVDCMTDTPESVLICEKTDDGTKLERLNPERLKSTLEKYRLGELWSSGAIGGNRW